MNTRLEIEMNAWTLSQIKSFWFWFSDRKSGQTPLRVMPGRTIRNPLTLDRGGVRVLLLFTFRLTPKWLMIVSWQINFLFVWKNIESVNWRARTHYAAGNSYQNEVAENDKSFSEDKQRNTHTHMQAFVSADLINEPNRCRASAVSIQTTQRIKTESK